MILIILALLLNTCDAATNKERDSPEKAIETSTSSKGVWAEEMNQITCCNGGTPTVPENLVKNFTIIPSDYTIEERTVDDLTTNCRDYDVRYWIQRPRVLSDADESESEIKLKCKCAETSPFHILDSNCRRQSNCKNNGVRSPNAPHECICAQPFFGVRCEKYCDHGQRLKSHAGREYCSCAPFYQGDECREMVCLNGGREENRRCICQQQYLGYHCEINTNNTGPGGSRFQRFGDQSSEMFTRDISGTIFSLIMIVVLVISMYLLMKHRMQTRYLNRRSDLLGACNFPMPASMTIASGPGSNNCLSASRRVEAITPDDRIYSFRPVAGIPDLGPPPYFQRGRGRNNREVLPPLPSYDEATKNSPSIRNNVPNEESLELTEEITEIPVRNTINEQPSSTTLSPNAELIVATVRGTEMVRAASTTRQTDNFGTLAEESDETSSISSVSSATSDASKPEQR